MKKINVEIKDSMAIKYQHNVKTSTMFMFVHANKFPLNNYVKQCNKIK